VDPGIRAQRLHVASGLQRCVEEIGKRLPNLGHIIILAKTPMFIMSRVQSPIGGYVGLQSHPEKQ
jgi:hypothetical protein